MHSDESATEESSMTKQQLIKLIFLKTGVKVKDVSAVVTALVEIEAESRHKLDLCMADVFDVLDKEVQPLLKEKL